jgi:hypothetical protein
MGKHILHVLNLDWLIQQLPFVRIKKKMSFNLSGYNQSLQAQIQKGKGLEERRDQNLSNARWSEIYFCGEQGDGLIDVAATFIYLVLFVNRKGIIFLRINRKGIICGVLGQEVGLMCVSHGMGESNDISAGQQ